jgi:hypothetical protein
MRGLTITPWEHAALPSLFTQSRERRLKLEHQTVGGERNETLAAEGSRQCIGYKKHPKITLLWGDDALDIPLNPAEAKHTWPSAPAWGSPGERTRSSKVVACLG